MTLIRDAASIANSIRMRRALFKGSFLLLEGESDNKVYSEFVNLDFCVIRVCHDKATALKALTILEADENFNGGTLAIVDADYSRFLNEGGLNNRHNLHVTDYHDLETMMIVSPALDKILKEFGSEEKIKKFFEELKSNVRDFLADCVKIIGFLRLSSLKNNWSLKFEGLKYKRFIGHGDLRLSISDLIKHVKDHSQNQILSNDIIEKSIRTSVRSFRD